MSQHGLRGKKQMPPKKSSKNGGVQSTLSKFFTSAPSSSGKKSSVVNITDEKDDFEVIPINTSKKRSNPKTEDEHTKAPKTKKICIEQTRAEELTGNSSKSSPTISPTSAASNSKTKLKQFELSEEEKGVSNEEKLCFQSKDCPMISFYDGTDGNEQADQTGHAIVIDDGDSNEKDEEGVSPKASSSLSAFAAVGASRGGKSNKAGSSAGSKPVKYTPLEQQVVDIKAQRPDALLCVECGYKYRFFGEDAQIAAKVLKIYCHLDHNFMTASIPTYRLFVHLRRLVAAGYKVGVVKQTETAHLKAAGDNKSGPFTRKLVGLYTKSTLIGQDLDPSSKSMNDEESGGADISPAVKQNQHLLCIFEQPSEGTATTQHVGIVCVDPATGDILYDDFQEGLTCSELETRISHLRPVEIILSTGASGRMKNFVAKTSSLSLTDDDKIRIEMVPDSYFTEAMATVNEFYKDASSLSFVHNLPKPTLGCLGALCTYLKDFQLESVLKLTSSFSRFSERSRFMYLSSQSLFNLEVFQNSCDGTEKGSLFWMLDHTKTKFGSRLLRKWLNKPLLSYEAIQGRLDAVVELLEGISPGLKSLSDLMPKLPDLERGLCSIFYQKCSPLEFRNVTHSLERVRKAVDHLSGSVKSPLLQSIVSGIFECLEGVGLFSKSINEKAARDNDLPNLFVDGLEDEGVAAVYSTKEKISEVMSAMQDHRKEVRLALRQPGLNYTTVLQTEFLVEVRNTQLKTVPSDWTQISSTKAVSRFHTPFLVKHYRKLNQLREQLQKDALEAWKSFLREFSTNFVTYKKAVTLLATMDCLLNLADVASQGSFCKPRLDKDAVHIEIVQGRHPIIEALSHGQHQYVPNDTNLTADKGPRVMTVSGPNMGGKSSYIRQVALISILAQIGSYVPAEVASLGIFDAIHTRMGASDDIFKGRSTFMVELHEAADIMEQATDRSLVILDELGRGTSTHDGVAIAHATLKHFITKCNCLVIFVTHFPMMSEFQAQYPDAVRNYHMAFLLGEGEDKDEIDVLTFLYQLTEGAAARSYGLNVARLAQVPHDILQVAARKSKLLEQALVEKRSRLEKFMNLYRAEPASFQKAMVDIDQC